MNNSEAIEIIKSNWPTSGFTRLQEALELAIKALSETDLDDVVG